jgi:RimJ/RimL family protein N-acetyltransferase
MASYAWGDRLPTLTTPRTQLRHLEESDIPALFAIFSDPQVMRYWSSPPMQSLTEASHLWWEIQEGFRSRRLFQWGIVSRETAELLGTCTLFHVDLVHRHAEIGFACARAHWGKGLAREAVSTVIEFAFTSLDLHRFEADADPRNENSLRLLERLGFRHEGCLRERYIVSGEIQDAVLLGLLRSEWDRSPERPRPAKKGT